MKRSGKTAKRKQHAGEAKRGLHENVLGPEWQGCWQSMQYIILWSLDERNAGREEETSEGEAWRADALAQSYLNALRRAVPNEPEKPVLYGIPLNLSERILLSHVRRLNDVLCELARAERWHACQELWDQAIKLVSTFNELALKHPEPFKNKARQSLSMPSLRVPPKLRKSKKGRGKWTDPFLGDAPKISASIELSADTIGAKISDNRGQLGGRCAQFVGQCVHEIKRARALWAHFFTPYGREVLGPTPEQVEPFRGKSQDVIAGIELSWPANEPGGSMKSHLRAVSSGTEADMRKELKDYCRDKVKQFA